MYLLFTAHLQSLSSSIDEASLTTVNVVDISSPVQSSDKYSRYETDAVDATVAITTTNGVAIQRSTKDANISTLAADLTTGLSLLSNIETYS